MWTYRSHVGRILLLLKCISLLQAQTLLALALSSGELLIHIRDHLEKRNVSFHKKKAITAIVNSRQQKKDVCYYVERLKLRTN